MQVMGIKTEDVQAHSATVGNANNGETEENNAQQQRPKRC